jgi:hypothetical protein
VPAPDDRDWVEKLVFGREKVRRFTQDSPVLPDVWLAYAAAPNDPLPLLLTPNMQPTASGGGTTTGMLRKALADALPAERARPGAWCRKGRRTPPPVGLAHNQATVLATLWFDELVRVVLPMSGWWFARVHPTGFDEQIGRLDLDQEGLLAKMLQNPDLSAAALGIAPADRPSPDLVWAVRVVGAIALARQKPAVMKRLRKATDLTLADYRLVTAAADDLMAGAALPTYGATPLVWNVSRNRPAEATVERSRRAVKADAAIRVFDAACATLTWVVIDSGIDATHPAFRLPPPKPTDPPPPPGAIRSRVKETFDFNYVQHLLSTAPDADDELPPWLQKRLKAEPKLKKQLKAFRAGLDSGGELDWGQVIPFVQIPHAADRYDPPVHEHGTHVAGIIAADWIEPAADGTGVPPPGGLHGICPDIRLYDLRVLDRDGAGDEFNIISALQFVRYLNGRQDVMAAHGVNLSLSLRHDVANYACGRTPVCQECERLVAAGVVVVAAAGNRGFEKYLTASGPLESYHSISITDPGNADAVITVGATHRTQPHAYGVSYFSSRGPTGDGRSKPDLVAPGEKIEAPVPGGAYKRMDGTSMAAPHVSGVAALLLARHRELIGQPARVKEVLCRTATDLGRERFFQGHGMVDALRALQAV